MALAIKETVRILNNTEISEDIFSMWLKTESISYNAEPGQFVSLFVNDGSALLPRPISICETDQKERAIRLVYRIVGKGTKAFSLLGAGDTLEVMGPLGNGFMLEATGSAGNGFTSEAMGPAGNGFIPEGTGPLGNGLASGAMGTTGKMTALVIGGGIGVPPMLELVKRLAGTRQIVLGYRDKDAFLSEEFKPYGRVYLSTEDGSRGTKGNVLDAIRANGLKADIIYACGPTPMLRGIQSYAGENQIRAQLSLEERMACGIGACLGCVCKSTGVDPHTNVKNKRICKDGPVFYADEVEL